MNKHIRMQQNVFQDEKQKVVRGSAVQCAPLGKIVLQVHQCLRHMTVRHTQVRLELCYI